MSDNDKSAEDIKRAFLEECFNALPEFDTKTFKFEGEFDLKDYFSELVLGGRADIRQGQKLWIFATAVAARHMHIENISEARPLSDAGLYLARVFSDIAHSLVDEVTPDDFIDYPEACWVDYDDD